MDEWKELKIDDLPRDILVGDYEFQFKNGNRFSDYSVNGIYEIIEELEDGCKIRYRKRQPKAPSHEEIMTKWWKMNEDEAWDKPIAYDNGKYVFILYGKESGKCKTIYETKKYFIGRQSATIPPEA